MKFSMMSASTNIITVASKILFMLVLKHLSNLQFYLLILAFSFKKI